MKKWLINNFLPMWAKETVLAENRLLRKKIARLEAENSLRKSYIDGIKLGTKKRTDDFCSYGERRKNNGKSASIE